MAYLTPALSGIFNFDAAAGYLSTANVTGFELAVSSTTVFTLQAGAARNYYNDFVINYPAAQVSDASYISVDISTVGANGCYPVAMNTVTNATVYPVYVIGDSTGTNTTAAIVCTNASPTNILQFLPAGYDSFRRVGLVYCDTSNHLISLLQTGHFDQRVYTLAAGVQVLNAGASTTAANVDLTTGSGPVVPSICEWVQFVYSFTPNNAANILYLVPTGLTAGTVAPIQVKTNGTVAVEGQLILAPGLTTAGNASVDYLLTSASDAASLWVTGFCDNLRLNAF